MSKYIGGILLIWYISNIVKLADVYQHAMTLVAKLADVYQHAMTSSQNTSKKWLGIKSHNNWATK